MPKQVINQSVKSKFVHDTKINKNYTTGFYSFFSIRRHQNLWIWICGLGDMNFTIFGEFVSKNRKTEKEQATWRTVIG